MNAEDDWLDALDALDTLGDRSETEPCRYARHTPPQRAFMSDPSLRKALVGANQSGKTLCGAHEALAWLRGWHPYRGRLRPAPVHGWCVNSSWKQSLIIQRKVYAELGADELAPSVKYSHKNGFSGGYLELRNGSTLTFVTAHQDTVDLASATLDFIWIDEPPPEHIWGELVSRVRQRRGTIFLTLTPIGRPVDWLRDMCEGDPDEGVEPSISLHRAPLTVPNVTPEGLPPLLTQAEIEAYERDLLPMERDQRVRGAWEGKAEGAVLDAFGDHCITEAEPSGRIEIGIGIDHGAKAGRQVAHLVFVGTISGRQVAWIWDEVVDEGRSTVEDDAAGILEMLARNGIQPKEVDTVIGDRPHSGDLRGNKKSNLMLRHALAKQIGRPVYQLPEAFRRMHTPNKWEGSVWHGFRVMNKMFAGASLFVHPRCTRFIEGAKYWEGSPRDPLKDGLDSARYALEKLVDQRTLFRRRVTA